MNERTPKHPPLDGERLKLAIAEMDNPTFFRRLTGSISKYAKEYGLYRNQMLPGGKTCDDLATDVIMLLLQGRRQWKESRKTFLEACKYVARSVLSNWCGLVDNELEWANCRYAVEDFPEDEVVEGVSIFPASNNETAIQITLRKEVQEKEQSQLLALSEMVESGSLEARIVQELFDDPGIEGRAQMVARLGCTGAEFDAAYKRLIRLEPKIKMKKEQ
jgi:hypothetical protein